MKQPTSKIIPEEILNLVQQTFNRNGVRKNTTGKWSYIPDLVVSVNHFIQGSSDRFPLYASKFYPGVSEDLMNRAFNRKSPNGATKELRNLLAHYATDGQHNWNELITQHFSDAHSHLVDDHEQPRPATDQKKISNEDIYNLLLQHISQNEISQPEYSIIEKQLAHHKALLPNQPEKISTLITLKHNEPEFPPAPFFKPSFPASNTYKIEVPGFSNVWVKDESTNPTGSHKDRMAWEITLNALRFNIPEISIISSGSAAIAIKYFFNLFEVKTKLKVLVDHELSEEIKQAIKAIGCELYETDLSSQSLNDAKIRELTHNQSGIDVTYRETMDVYNIQYYDWLSYEILNNNPDYCFIPFGTGDLFINVLKTVQQEYNARHFSHDPRFSGDIKTIKQCNFFGATTKSKDSRLDKLFSYFLPSMDNHKLFIKNLKQFDCIGQLSNIHFVDERHVDQAMEMAAAAGVNCEPSGIAGLALLLQMKNKIPAESRILIVNTGRTRYYPSH
jgi:cysteine synthase